MIKLNVVKYLKNAQAICICKLCKKDYLVKSRYDIKRPQGRKLVYCKPCKTFVQSMEVTQENLRKAFTYDLSTGDFTYNYPTKGKDIGDCVIATHNLGGYGISASISGKLYLVHRLIFMYMEGYFPVMVDHINHNRTDNRWANLREVNALGNAKNTTMQKNSTTKVMGVSIHKPTGKFRAYVGVNYKQVHLGLFDTIEEASSVRAAAIVKFKYHNNHGNV